MRYLKPTPLAAELRFEGWVERVEGREVHTHGRVLHGEVVTVEAAGVFVQISHERVMQLLGDPDAGAQRPAAGDPPAAAATAPRADAPRAAESPAARRRRFRSSGDGS